MKILPKINSPQDVKKLDQCELEVLACEIRETIIETTSKNGGHLASNLGMVEPTIAIHRVFDCPKDTVIFDVGHQAYAHKLITGRYGVFSTLRRAGGISGFTNREESEYDATIAGHSGCAVSTAVGMAEADRIAGRDNYTVVVIGDGSFTGGMVYEALNQLAAKKLRLVIILNDNEMSISKNVGGLSRYLSYIRTSEKYFNFKLALRTAFEKIPIVGEGLVEAARGTKNFLKRIFSSETLFESLGMRYIGPVNGNDIERLSGVLEEAKSRNVPVVVHMITKKGLGFEPAEEHPEKFHSTSGFSYSDRLDYIEKQNVTTPKRTFADEFSDIICEIGEKNDKICTITAAMTDGCGLSKFAKLYPERFLDVGIAEEHAIAMAGGLALRGMIPVVVLYSTFAQRVFDQLWHDAALQRANIVLCLSHAGLVAGDGVTHQGVFDVSLFSPIPDVTIWSPDTLPEFYRAIDLSVNGDGVCIVRYPKGSPNMYDGLLFDDHGTWKTANFGSGSRLFAIVTYGRITANVINAVRSICDDSCDTEDVSFRLCVLERIFPLPSNEELYDILSESERVFVIEEVVRRGGIGEILAADERVNTNVSVIAIEEDRIPHGDIDYLTRYVGLDTESLKKKIMNE